MAEILFYKANGPHGYLSNLSRYEVVFENRRFETAEHAYQAGKPRDMRVRDWLLAAPTSALLAKAAHQLTRPWEVMPGWSKARVPRMRAVLRAKFSQHADIGDALVATGHARIVENGTIDDEAGRFWGIVNGRGKNMLGELLMETRAWLAAPVIRIEVDA